MLVVVAVTGFFVLALLALVTFPWDRNRAFVGGSFRLLARTAIRLVPWWTFRAEPPYPRRLTRAYVVVSNHESHLDAFLISHLPWEMKWLAKRSLFRIPFIGWSMALAGDVAVTRGARDSVGQALLRCRRYLERGMSVFLFPEGTRAVGEVLQPFKAGAFRLALETGCPVLPVAVAGTRNGLRKGDWLFRRCRAQVRVGEAIEVAPVVAAHTSAQGDVDWTAATAQLMAQSRAQIAALRDGLRAELGREA